jgi:aldose 1-epimerase
VTSWPETHPYRLATQSFCDPLRTAKAGHWYIGGMIPITGAQYEISAGDYRATVTELGAGLRELTHAGRPLITSYGQDDLPPGAAGQLLAPWPNRIDHGRYDFAGATYQLDLSEPASGNAIHGLTRWASWAPVQHEPDRVLLTHVLHGRPGYPFCLELDAQYQVGADGLQVTITVRNAGSRPAPYGTGSHPYLTGGTPIDDYLLTIPAAQWLQAGERGIPFGQASDVAGTPLDFRQARPVGGTQIDHAFTGLERDAEGKAWTRVLTASGELALWVGEGYRWLQLFTSDTLAEPHRRQAIAVEPMSCPPNSFVTGQDLITLDPGESSAHVWGLEFVQL